MNLNTIPGRDLTFDQWHESRKGQFWDVMALLFYNCAYCGTRRSAKPFICLQCGFDNIWLIKHSTVCAEYGNTGGICATWFAVFDSAYVAQQLAIWHEPPELPSVRAIRTKHEPK